MSRTLLLFGLALMVAGVVFASTPVDHGDSSCGQALWNTVDTPTCDMAQRRAVSVALFGGGAVLAIVGSRSTLVAVALCAAAVAALVCANRLLEPADDNPMCGSIVNEHTTNGVDPSRDQACDKDLEPHRNQAIAAGIVTVAFLALAGLTDKLRQPEPI
jgi:hypothetical protein